MVTWLCGTSATESEAEQHRDPAIDNTGDIGTAPAELSKQQKRRKKVKCTLCPMLQNKQASLTTIQDNLCLVMHEATEHHHHLQVHELMLIRNKSASSQSTSKAAIRVGHVTYMNNKLVRYKKQPCFLCKVAVQWLSRHFGKKSCQ